MRSERPPLPAWPERAFPGEGAHGWFQRLAKANGQISARTLAEFLGLNGRDPKPAELLEACLSFPMQNSASLIEATPILSGSTITLLSQAFRYGRDFSFNRPRICPDCIAESRYYRSWYDIQAISNCPIHHHKLLGGTGTDRLAWWYPEIGVTPDGTDLSRVTEGAGQVNVDWDAYVLSRVGIVPQSPAPLLDGTPMEAVIRVSAWLGRMQFDDEGQGQRRFSRSSLAAKGFNLLLSGDAGLHTFFTARLHRANERRSGGRERLGADGILGPLALNLAEGETELEGRIQDALRGAVAASGLHPRRSKLMPSLPDGRRRLNEVAAQLRLKPSKALEVAVRLGITERLKTGALGYSFSPEAVTRITSALQTSINRADAAARLGLCSVDPQPLIDAGELRPLVRIGGRTRSSDRFLPDDIEALLKSLKGRP